tara:strand:- start:3237 stop:3686 length:450 start_codon:yes stop_codon:yes gene_type:complete
LNYIFFINRNFIFYFGICIVSIFLIFIFSKKTNKNNAELEEIENKQSKVDISEPKFAINNNQKKIYVTAKEGNFLSKDEILLKKDVIFKSNEFSIETEKVVFNRNDQTAQSKTESLFKSEKTTITSKGFDIFEKGNKIIFYGKSYIVLK